VAAIAAQAQRDGASNVIKQTAKTAAFGVPPKKTFASTTWET
jgi:hypothetical protein